MTDTIARSGCMRMLTSIATAIAVLFLLSLATTLPIAKNADAYSDISITVDCPTFAAKSDVVMCTLTVSGGPAGDVGGNFSYKAEIEADNITGSLISPSTGSSASGVFKLNITMPGYAPQSIMVKFNVTSEDAATGDSTEDTKDIRIEVIDPITLRATVYNTGSVDAVNVTAKFYGDGIYLGTRTFDIAAGNSIVLHYNWTWASISDGKHTATIVIDEANGLVEFSNGNNVCSLTIYVGDESNPLGAVLTVGVIIMSVFVFLTFLQKPPTRKK